MGCRRSADALGTAQRGAFVDRQRGELTRWGVIAAGCYQPRGRRLIKVVCFPGPRLDLRYVAAHDGACEPLRGTQCAVSNSTARPPTRPETVSSRCVMRMVTFTAMDIDDLGRWFRFLVMVWRTAPARSGRVQLLTRVGARATNGCGPARHWSSR